MEAREFVAGLVAEMEQLFGQLGELETLESESDGRVEVITLLKLALASELEASDLAGLWLPTTPEIDAKSLLADQCADEMKHYRMIAARLAELGVDPETLDPIPDGYSPHFEHLRRLRTTVERIAAGPFAREAIAKVRNAQFIDFCRSVGDDRTADMYEQVINPEEIRHHEGGRRVLERLCTDAESQDLATRATRHSLAIADELRTLAEKSTGLHPIPVS